jgi:hypothetical protein
MLQMGHFCLIVKHKCRNIYYGADGNWFMQVKEQALDAMH